MFSLWPIDSGIPYHYCQHPVLGASSELKLRFIPNLTAPLNQSRQIFRPAACNDKLAGFFAACLIQSNSSKKEQGFSLFLFFSLGRSTAQVKIMFHSIRIIET
jgi:hypothetical protein